MLSLIDCQLFIQKWQPIADEILENYPIYNVYDKGLATGPLCHILQENTQDDGCNLIVCDVIENQNHIILLEQAKKEILKFSNKKVQAIAIFCMMRQSELPYWITPIFSYSLN